MNSPSLEGMQKSPEGSMGLPLETTRTQEEAMRYHRHIRLNPYHEGIGTVMVLDERNHVILEQTWVMSEDYCKVYKQLVGRLENPCDDQIG